MRDDNMISVGICTYNGAKYIEEQLNSIINQTVKPDEIVLSDDNSTDETVTIADKVLRKSGLNYTFKTHKNRVGITKNFTDCFDSCVGDIIFGSSLEPVGNPNPLLCRESY